MIKYFLPTQNQFKPDPQTSLVPTEPRSLKEALQHCRNKTLAMINILEQIAEDPTQYGSTRVSAANKILEFAWGKPGNVSEHSELGDDSEVIEMTALQTLSPEERFSRAQQVMKILEEEVIGERGN